MILYNSEQTKQTTQKHFKEAMHIPNANAYIIAHPLRIKRELTDEDYFLYIGNMEKRKGVDLLLKGYKRYREKGGHKRLILGGKMQEDDIQALLDQLQSVADLFRRLIQPMGTPHHKDPVHILRDHRFRGIGKF